MRDADKEQTKEEDMASRHVTLKENFSQAFCIFIEESNSNLENTYKCLLLLQYRYNYNYSSYW